MRRDLRPQPPLCRACPPSFALGNVCSHSPPITSLGSPAGQFCAITQNEHTVPPKVVRFLRRPQSPIETGAHRFLILCGLARPAVLIVGDVKTKSSIKIACYHDVKTQSVKRAKHCGGDLGLGPPLEPRLLVSGKAGAGFRKSLRFLHFSSLLQS